MKKIILSTLVAVCATLSYGQRMVDMQTTMNSPTASTVIRIGSPYTLNFTLKNLGPDVIKTTDTVVVITTANNNILNQFIITLAKDMEKDSSVTYNVNNLGLTGGGGNINFCTNGVVYSNISPDTVYDNRIGAGNTKITNNSSCVTLKFSGTGIGKLEATKGMSSVSYPNPASSNMTIAFSTASAEKVSVEIYDIQGKLINTIDNGFTAAGEQSINVNVSDLTKGVYFYKVISGDMISTNKFTVE